MARLVQAPDTTTAVPTPWQPLLRDMTDRAAPNRPTAEQVRERLVGLAGGVSAIPATPAAAVVVGAGAAAVAPTALRRWPPLRPRAAQRSCLRP